MRTHIAMHAEWAHELSGTALSALFHSRPTVAEPGNDSNITIAEAEDSDDASDAYSDAEDEDEPLADFMDDLDVGEAEPHEPGSDTDTLVEALNVTNAAPIVGTPPAATEGTNEV